MSGDDYNLLVQSIRETGLRVPIKLIGEDQVFDGWNRLRACAETGVEPVFESVDESDDLEGLTVSAQPSMSSSDRRAKRLDRRAACKHR
jgi:ParB-like nuclease domain